MSATEPLRHVTVHGRHLFIPRSLTDSSYRPTTRRRGHSAGHTHRRTKSAARPKFGDPRESEGASAEERRVLHELLAAVVLSASCRCTSTDASLVDDDAELSESVNGNTSSTSWGSPSCTTATIELDEIRPSSFGSVPSSPPPSPPQSRLRPDAPSSSLLPTAACNCAHAQTVACAVAVVLISCALLRSTYD